MAEIFDLEYLLERRQPAPAAARIKLQGREYELLGVEGLENFLVYVGTVQKLLNQPVELPAGNQSAAVLTMVSELYTELVEETHRMIRALVADLPESVLRDHFSTLPAARALLMTLIDLTRDSASELVKKNAGGAGTQTRKRRSRRGGRGRKRRSGGASTTG